MPSPFVNDGTAGIDLLRVDDNPTTKVGQRNRSDDGHDWCYLQASAAIAAAASPGTQIAITEPAFTAAAGAGGWYAPVAGVLINQYFWGRRSAL